MIAQVTAVAAESSLKLPPCVAQGLLAAESSITNLLITFDAMLDEDLAAANQNLSAAVTVNPKSSTPTESLCLYP